MPDVAVEKHHNAEKPVWSLFEETRKLFDEIQSRAFGLFEERNGGDGSPLDDWFRAEREMCSVPPSELAEDDKEFHLTAAVPGLKAKEIKVTATPREVVIQGESSKRKKGSRKGVQFSELSEKQVFRRVDLPASIDVDGIKAKLEDGMLSIDMPKSPVHKVEVKASAK
jgi:HSP20 family protein